MICFLLVGRRKKREKKKTERKREKWLGFSQGWRPDTPSGCARWGFHICYMQLKADLRVSL
jgi:hypothetical protein